MFRFSSLFSVFCAGCFCTLTVQQVPAWSEAALPRTQAIAPDVRTAVRAAVPLSAPPVSTAAAVPVCTTESAAAVPPPTATPLTTAPPLATSGTSLETTTETTATTTSTCTTVITTETTAVSTEAPQTPPETDSFFQEYDTAFKAYMDYRTITDTSSEQYAIQQNAWTDSRGLRRSCDDYLVAMGTGWLTEGCGDRIQVTLESQRAGVHCGNRIALRCRQNRRNGFRLSGIVRQHCRDRTDQHRTIIMPASAVRTSACVPAPAGSDRTAA